MPIAYCLLPGMPIPHETWPGIAYIVKYWQILTERGMFLKNKSSDSKADLTKLCPLGVHCWTFKKNVLALMSAAIHPQGFIIWGSQDPSSKYVMALYRYALSHTRYLFSQLSISVFSKTIRPPPRVHFRKKLYLSEIAA